VLPKRCLEEMLSKRCSRRGAMDERISGLRIMVALSSISSAVKGELAAKWGSVNGEFG
jgi:hypothetical protein